DLSAGDDPVPDEAVGHRAERRTRRQDHALDTGIAPAAHEKQNPQAGHTHRQSRHYISLALRVAPRLASRKCCSRTAAAKASTSPFRPRTRPPCSRTAASARAVLIRSSQSSTGRRLRRETALASSRAARAVFSSWPSDVSGRPTTAPTG